MTPHDRHHEVPREPLDPDERELARVLRALPGHEPPTALDVRILKAAQGALASTADKPKHRHRWLLAGSGWGLGTAAAAVLTVGVSWQLLQRPSLPPAPAPAAQSVAAPAAEEHRLSVDLIEREPRVLNTPPPPDDASAQTAERKARAQRQSTTESARELRREVVAPSPVVMAPPEAFSDEHVDHAPAPPAAPPAPAAGRGLAKASADAANNVVAQAVDADALQRVRSDQRLTVDAWLRRIERRLDDGDFAGARASLALLRERHPDVRIPATVRERLQE